MRLLLTGILVLLPLTAQAEYTDNLSANELNPDSIVDPFDARNPDDPDRLLNESSPYGNPYSPASATNFEAITALSRYDLGLQSVNRYEADWLSHPFSHYGNPYAPNQFNNR